MHKFWLWGSEGKPDAPLPNYTPYFIAQFDRAPFETFVYQFLEKFTFL